jgi:hypothetical protein
MTMDEPQLCETVAPCLPAPILTSPLMQHGGYMVVNPFVTERVWKALLAEAYDTEKAHRTISPGAADVSWRGGNPARAYRAQAGGQVQYSIYGAPAMIAMLARLTGIQVVPAGRGSYSYYERPGDFLALHRDIVTCDIAVITCLHDDPAIQGGGRLVLYPEYIHQPLSAIRSHPSPRATHVHLQPGQTIILLGGFVPHALTPVVARQQRVVSIMCYRVLST